MAAARAWGLPEADGDPHGVLDWFIRPTTAAREDYRELYGYIRESAGRHGLAPEFLQVVFFGEGGGTAITPGFDPARVIDTCGFAGLDLILYRTGRLPVGAPPVPPEAVAAGDASEIAEYSFNLVTERLRRCRDCGSRDARGPHRSERSARRTLHVGRVTGWKAAIELVAAELHARLDEMTAYLAAKVPPIPSSRRTSGAFSRTCATRRVPRPRAATPTISRCGFVHGAERYRRWASQAAALPHFLAIQRVAVTQWQEAAAVYRSTIE